jgi:hypothetical protein
MLDRPRVCGLAADHIEGGALTSETFSLLLTTTQYIFETGRMSWFQSLPRIRGVRLLAQPRRLCLISPPRVVALRRSVLYDGL